MSMHGLGKPTADEQRRIDACKEFGCIVSRLVHGVRVLGEYHHIPLGNNSSHRFGFVLSPWYHRGVVDEGQTVRSMREMHGPSLFHHKREFIARFGDQQHLLNKTDDAIGYPRVELPDSKIFPRAA